MILRYDLIKFIPYLNKFFLDLSNLFPYINKKYAGLNSKLSLLITE